MKIMSASRGHQKCSHIIQKVSMLRWEYFFFLSRETDLNCEAFLTGPTKSEDLGGHAEIIYNKFMSSCLTAAKAHVALRRSSGSSSKVLHIDVVSLAIVIYGDFVRFSWYERHKTNNML